MFTKISAKQFAPALFSLTGISKKTVEEHLKLYQGYVNKYNEINEKLQTINGDGLTKANQVYSQIRELKTELSFAWGGVVNHEIYFGHLGGKGGRPPGELLKQIKTDFGSWDHYLKDLQATGMAARGWVWTGWNQRESRLINYLGDSQNTYLVWEVKPIVALDVYEHAYFIDYGVNRAGYIDAFVNNLDWQVVGDRFSRCQCDCE
ncbi:Fe-Mn family superoxide dismutase [Patescibacteria group bacterium]|nr:Fe-Mn family superoxide dismutase [Patescibacteria group bacterium]MCL5091283.1 Fe-Mn family superoxide dismutase [Patescibacteria group bacterium]